MKSISLRRLAAPFLSAALALTGAAAEKKPNIVHIVADDSL